jgi:hypothetical protein
VVAPIKLLTCFSTMAERKPEIVFKQADFSNRNLNFVSSDDNKLLVEIGGERWERQERD